jgi:hypothetical protein
MISSTQQITQAVERCAHTRRSRRDHNTSHATNRSNNTQQSTTTALPTAVRCHTVLRVMSGDDTLASLVGVFGAVHTVSSNACCHLSTFATGWLTLASAFMSTNSMAKCAPTAREIRCAAEAFDLCRHRIVLRPNSKMLHEGPKAKWRCG